MFYVETYLEGLGHCTADPLQDRSATIFKAEALRSGESLKMIISAYSVPLR
jgi:hypothetical protein